MNWKKWLAISATVVVLSVLVFAAWRVDVALSHLDAMLDQTAATEKALGDYGKDIDTKAGETLDQADKVLDSLNEDVRAARPVIAETKATVTDVRRNVVIIAGIATDWEKASRKDAQASIATTQAAGKLLSDSDKKLNGLLTSLQPGIASFNSGMAGLAGLVNDPAIRQSISHTNNVMAHADASSGDIAAWVHRHTAPIKGFWNHVKASLGLMIKGLEVWKIFGP